MTTASSSRPPSASSSSRPFLGIGEVLAQLSTDFPDVSISKIRFLEAEGLVEPQRAASGYRKFSRDDVERLRYVLGAQRDHYLPLRVIKEHLNALDRGLESPLRTGSTPQVPEPNLAVEGLPAAEDFGPAVSELRLSRAELLGAAGLVEAQLAALEQYGLVTVLGGGHYDGDALLVARTVAAMSRYGLEARHLRPFRIAADREVGLVEQVVAPLTASRSAEARGRAQEALRELAALSVRLHALLVKAGLRSLS